MKQSTNVNAIETFKRAKSNEPRLPDPKELEKINAAIDEAAKKISLDEPEANVSGIDEEAKQILRNMRGAKLQPEEGEDNASPRSYEQEIADLKKQITKDNYFQADYSELFLGLPYKKKLEILGITEESVATITDSLIMHGFYEKSFNLRGKLQIVFRSREGDVYMKSIESLLIGSSRLKMIEQISLFNCAGSLMQYGTQVYKPLSVLPSNERLAYLQQKSEFILSLPAVLYNFLSVECTKFDILLSIATSQEALGNF